jgi:FAD/FMN-containing dehydrogenase
MKNLNKSISANYVNKLGRIFEKSEILVDAESFKIYGTDWTTYYSPNPSAIVFPRSIDQVQKLVHWANQYKIALVPSGGRTGLSGGAMALNGEIIVSFEKLNRILEFNEIDQTVAVEAGVVTETLHNFAIEHNLIFPVDFAAKGSSQIGGNIATNSGGIKVIHYGSIRDWVMGLKVVTGKGDILNLNQGLVKNAAGYDLRHLFIGSEGTLGFIIEATLKLTYPVKEKQVFLFALTDLSAVIKVFQIFRQKLDLYAFEFFSEIALQKVLENQNSKKPLKSRAPYFVLLEFNAESETIIEMAHEAYQQCVDQNIVLDEAISHNDTQTKELWSYRENIAESIQKYKPYNFDISVRRSNIPDFVMDAGRVLTSNYSEFEVLWFGHIGDGNLHITVLKPENMAQTEFQRKCEKVNELLFEVVHKYHGSISAEHGVGIFKKPYLHYSRTAEEIDYMRGIKKVFDPNGIMNPNKIFDIEE